MGLYKLNDRCGNHDQGGVTYKAGDFIETELPLGTMFKGKFTRVSETGDALVNLPSEPNIPLPKKDTPIDPIDDEGVEDEVEVDEDEVEVDEEEDEVEVDEKALIKQYGKNVTTKFKTAVEIGVLVFAKGNWHTVYDPSDGEVFNDKKLAKKDVPAFLKTLVED